MIRWLKQVIARFLRDPYQEAEDAYWASVIWGDEPTLEWHPPKHTQCPCVLVPITSQSHRGELARAWLNEHLKNRRN